MWNENTMIHGRDAKLDLDRIKAVFVDADDTLWENNLFFLACMHWISREGRRLGFTNRAVTRVLNRHEHKNISKFGYGYDVFERSILATSRELAYKSGHVEELPRLVAQSRSWLKFLRNHPIIFLDGVCEVLPKIAEKIPTYIVTKGNHRDQMAKVIRSGLLPDLHGAHVVPHKLEHNYRELLEEMKLKADEAIMIGNSPASDINNPKKIGIQTVFVPHKQTWTKELEHITLSDPKTIYVSDFHGLKSLFRLV